MADGSVNLSEYARQRGVSHEAVRKAVKVGRLARSVVWSSAGKPRLISSIADEEWDANTDSSQQRRPVPVPPASELPPPTPRFRPPKPRTEAPEAEPEPEPEAAAAPEPRTGTFQQARTLREAYMARLAKLEFEEKSGKLVHADAVKNEAFKTARMVRDNLLNIPDRVAGELAAEANQFKVHQRLTLEIRRALEDMRAEP